jgi:hypothetical protein
MAVNKKVSFSLKTIFTMAVLQLSFHLEVAEVVKTDAEEIRETT